MVSISQHICAAPPSGIPHDFAVINHVLVLTGASRIRTHCFATLSLHRFRQGRETVAPRQNPPTCLHLSTSLSAYASSGFGLRGTFVGLPMFSDGSSGAEHMLRACSLLYLPLAPSHSNAFSGL